MDDGYCTSCGRKHAEPTKRTNVPGYDTIKESSSVVNVGKATPLARPVVEDTPAPTKPAPVWEEAPTDPWEYVVWACNRIMDYYDMSYTIRRGRGRATYFRCHFTQTEKCLLNLGIKWINEKIVTNGKYHEYPTVAYLLKGQELYGWDAVKQMVKHELAHALVHHRGQAKRGVIHGATFKKAYQDIMDAGII